MVMVSALPPPPEFSYSLFFLQDILFFGILAKTHNKKLKYIVSNHVVIVIKAKKAKLKVSGTTKYCTESSKIKNV